MLGTEQPNENQSAFGPSNQSSTFEDPNQSINTGQAGTDNKTKSPWAAQNYQPSSNSGGALPWQNNDTQPLSNPSWNVGHDGTQNNMNREQWRDSWMSSGTSNNQMMDQWLAQNGGQRLNDAGVVRTPYGEILDMGFAFKTGNGRPAFTDIGMNSVGQTPVSPFGPSQQNAQQQGPDMTAMIQQLMKTNPSMFMNQDQKQPAMQQNPGYNFNTNNESTMDISSFLGPSAQAGMMDYRPSHLGLNRQVEGRI